MRKTRLVIQPKRCLHTIGFLLIYLSCPVIGDSGRIRPDTDMSHRAVAIQREGARTLIKDPSSLMRRVTVDGHRDCRPSEIWTRTLETHRNMDTAKTTQRLSDGERRETRWYDVRNQRLSLDRRIDDVRGRFAAIENRRDLESRRSDRRENPRMALGRRIENSPRYRRDNIRGNQDRETREVNRSDLRRDETRQRTMRHLGATSEREVTRIRDRDSRSMNRLDEQRDAPNFERRSLRRVDYTFKRDMVSTRRMLESSSRTLDNSRTEERRNEQLNRRSTTPTRRLLRERSIESHNRKAEPEIRNIRPQNIQARLLKARVAAPPEETTARRETMRREIHTERRLLKARTAGDSLNRRVVESNDRRRDENRRESEARRNTFERRLLRSVENTRRQGRQENSPPRNDRVRDISASRRVTVAESRSEIRNTPEDRRMDLNTRRQMSERSVTRQERRESRREESNMRIENSRRLVRERSLGTEKRSETRLREDNRNSRQVTRDLTRRNEIRQSENSSPNRRETMRETRTERREDVRENVRTRAERQARSVDRLTANNRREMTLGERKNVQSTRNIRTLPIRQSENPTPNRREIRNTRETELREDARENLRTRAERQARSVDRLTANSRREMVLGERKNVPSTRSIRTLRADDTQRSFTQRRTQRYELSVDRDEQLSREGRKEHQIRTVLGRNTERRELAKPTERQLNRETLERKHAFSRESRREDRVPDLRRHAGRFEQKTRSVVRSDVQIRRDIRSVSRDTTKVAENRRLAADNIRTASEERRENSRKMAIAATLQQKQASFFGGKPYPQDKITEMFASKQEKGSRITDLAANCILGAVVWYMASRNVKPIY